MRSCIKIYSTGNHFQFILIRNCTKMITLPTLCISGNSYKVKVHKVSHVIPCTNQCTTLGKPTKWHSASLILNIKQINYLLDK